VPQKDVSNSMQKVKFEGCQMQGVGGGGANKVSNKSRGSQWNWELESGGVNQMS
jgi:hypothetical protein